MSNLYKKPRIIVPIIEKDNLEYILSQNPDMIELRADYFGDEKDIKKIMAKIKTIREDMPILFTYRTISEGGLGDEKKHSKIIEKFARCEYVDILDVEIENKSIKKEHILKIKSGKKNVIGSYHSLEGELDKGKIYTLVAKMADYDVDTFKICLNLQDEREVLELLDISYEVKLKYPDKKIIFISMGEKGRITRIFCADYTFAYCDKQSADGQIEIADMKKILSIVYKNK